MNRLQALAEGVTWRRALAGGFAAFLLFVLARIAFLLVRRARMPAPVAEAVIADPENSTTIDEGGAVTSIQAADLTMPEADAERIWNPQHLERLARTYWRFLSRCTLGFIRVEYTETERFVVLVTRPFVLLTFKAPEYEMDTTRGIVRWRIEKGLLVSKRGRDKDGYLEIDVTRRDAPAPGKAMIHVEVEIANFYPFIADSVSRRVYRATQATIHVLVTHGFLRSLARLDLSESRVGRYATPDTMDEVPDPPAREPARADTA